jgi:hypothetical protein
VKGQEFHLIFRQVLETCIELRIKSMHTHSP